LSLAQFHNAKQPNAGRLAVIKRARELLRGLADDELLKVMRHGD